MKVLFKSIVISIGLLILLSGCSRLVDTVNEQEVKQEFIHTSEVETENIKENKIGDYIPEGTEYEVIVSYLTGSEKPEVIAVYHQYHDYFISKIIVA